MPQEQLKFILCDKLFQLDIWYSGPDSTHVFIPPEKLDDVKDFLTRNHLMFSVINDHVQKYVYCFAVVPDADYTILRSVLLLMKFQFITYVHHYLLVCSLYRRSVSRCSPHCIIYNCMLCMPNNFITVSSCIENETSQNIECSCLILSLM